MHLGCHSSIVCSVGEKIQGVVRYNTNVCFCVEHAKKRTCFSVMQHFDQEQNLARSIIRLECFLFHNNQPRFRCTSYFNITTSITQICIVCSSPLFISLIQSVYSSLCFQITSYLPTQFTGVHIISLIPSCSPISPPWKGTRPQGKNVRSGSKVMMGRINQLFRRSCPKAQNQHTVITT